MSDARSLTGTLGSVLSAVFLTPDFSCLDCRLNDHDARLTPNISCLECRLSDHDV